MLSTKQKIRVLENFRAMDYMFFGKPVTKMTTCCPVVLEDYINLKGGLMTVMIEMYKLVKVNPIIENYIKPSKLIEMAKNSAVIARDNAKKLVATESGRLDIKKTLHEAMTTEKDFDVNDLVEQHIRQKSFSLAVDNLLIARTIAESSEKNIKKLNEWEGTILEDAYKVMRDSLVEQALNILTMNEITK